MLQAKCHMDAIPGEIALQLRAESRQENRCKRYTPGRHDGPGVLEVL